MIKLEDVVHKDRKEFTLSDLLEVIEELKLDDISLLYSGIDGRVKELRVPINDLDYAEMIISQGERIDGSSIFKGVIDTSNSDLYIVPRYETAFISPFDDKNLCLVCTFLDGQGNEIDFSPESVLKHVHQNFKDETGYELWALGELEFYLIYDSKDERFPATIQRNYHESIPFVKTSDVVKEMSRTISKLTGAVKYAHSEVGVIPNIKSDIKEIDGKSAEQFEIEFLLRPVEDMALYLTLSKWIIRNIANKNNMTATFTPKLMTGMAGTGLHFHMALFKDQTNMMVDENNELSLIAKKMMASICHHSSTITAFANMVASSFLRLVMGQEAPINVCWSEQNRQALMRVPLGFKNMKELTKKIHGDKFSVFEKKRPTRQTVEYRGSDCSADIHLTLAALILATHESFRDPKYGDLVEAYHVKGDIYKEMERLKLNYLPKSCHSAAEALKANREYYQKNGFPARVIDHVYNLLLKENDGDLISEFQDLSQEGREKMISHLMHKNLHL